MPPACPNGYTYKQEIKCHTQSCEKVDGCGKADILYVLDSSGSVGDLNWFIEKQFTIDVSKALDIGSDETRVGVVSYSTEVSLDLGLGDNNDMDDIEEAIWGIPWMAGYTNTADGIRLARKEFAEEARTGVKKIMVVVTDGNSNVLNETTIPQADLARAEGILVFVIGIGDSVNDAELLGIGNTPSDTYVYHVEDFEALPGITQAIVEGTCEPVVECGDWSTWSTCSANCGGGTENRTRQCTESVDGDVKRRWTDFEDRACAEQDCPICGDWTKDGDCSKSCGGGNQRMVRVCGTETETTNELCNLQLCPTLQCNGWEASDECSVSCGQGTQTYTRQCQWIHGDGALGDREDEEEIRDCFMDACEDPDDITDCSQCLYSLWDTDYLPDTNNPCKFYMCVRYAQPLGGYTYVRHHMPCGAGTLWDQTILTCSTDNDGVCTGATAPVDPVGPGVCNLEAVAGDNTKFRQRGGPVQSCAAGTVFDLDECTCVHGSSSGSVEACDGPLLYFKFDDDFKSSGCEKVEAYQAGVNNVKFAWDSKNTKSAEFDGSSVLVVPFLKNYFANRDLQAFTVALWFKWTGNPSAIGGLVNNGDCESDPSFDIHVGDSGEVVSGQLHTDGPLTTSTTSGDQSIGRWDWIHVAQTYDGQTHKLYINGVEKSSTDIQGAIANTHCSMIIGQLGQDEQAGLFTGYMDELRVYTRTLDADEIATLL